MRLDTGKSLLHVGMRSVQSIGRRRRQICSSSPLAVRSRAVPQGELPIQLFDEYIASKGSHGVLYHMYRCCMPLLKHATTSKLRL